MSDGLLSVFFRIEGKVQGVFFRKHTALKAVSLGLVGWVKNEDDGSVQGEVQGVRTKIEAMRKWLRTEGSPKSRIDKAVFQNRAIDALEYEEFSVRRGND
eukprot:comp13665_c0_seq1/m.19132 comp13665_c0_seq1/g.19132  ORF comp13665_c0_seq1/g.19132 comp13665_c0_seq1/m.19132 type:complete len:100 (-) comp13665_c0_seq1:43-342(-)